MTRKTILCLIAFLVLTSIQGTVTQVSAATNVLVMIDRVNGKFVYKVENKVVPNNKLIDRLAERLPAGGPKPAPGLVLVVHPDVTLEMLEQARGLVTKVGFDWPRVFVLTRNKRYMTELTISNQPIRYSADGEVGESE